MARFSADVIGLIVVSRSTKSRYPLSVGTRPALVWGWVISPSSSSAAMSLRTVAGRDAETVPLDECLGADRLLRGDVVLDDGAEHGEAAFVLHRHLLASRRFGTHHLGVPTLLQRSSHLPDPRLAPWRDSVRWPTGSGWPGRSGTTSTSASSGDRTALIVVDTQASARAARTIVEEVRELGIGDVTAIVNTHEHFDHTFGNVAFREAYGEVPIHAHEVAAERTVDAGEQIKERIEPDWDDPYRDEVLETEIVPADHTFSSVRVLDLGDRQVELIHPGRGHTAGDAVDPHRRRGHRAGRRPGRGERPAGVRRGLPSRSTGRAPSTW